MKKLLDFGMGATATAGGFLFYSESKNPWWLVYAGICIFVTLYRLVRKE